MSAWQWLVGIAEMVFAFWGTRWLCHPDHRAERLAFFTRRPKLRKDATITEHQQWLKTQPRTVIIPRCHDCRRCSHHGAYYDGVWRCQRCTAEAIERKTKTNRRVNAVGEPGSDTGWDNLLQLALGAGAIYTGWKNIKGTNWRYKP